MGYRISFYCLFIYIVCPYVAATLTCPPGTFLYTVIHSGEQFCIECQDETYMSLNNHRQTSCRPCEKIKDLELEILISPCNKTHDAVIHCVDGYYRDEARNPRETGQCRKCTECPKFTGQPCSTYRDTVCCWDENYDVVPNNDGVPMCRERPWFCRRGQFFDTRGFYCLPCPVNTFMPLDYHIQPECWKCIEYHKYDSYRPLHSVIIQPCNSTHAPVIRCEDGFFIKPNMGYRDDAIGCSPCTDCSTKTDVQYEGRKCDGMEDSVCCPQPNMAVIETSNGPVCCPEANMTVVDTSLKGPVCCPQPNMTVMETSKGHVCCPEAKMTVVDTSEGPVCRASSNNLGLAPPVPVTDQATTTDPDLKNDLSADVDSKFTDGSRTISGSLSAGILVGIFLALVYYLIYRRFFRRRWHRWLNARKRSSRSESNVYSEDGGAGENDSLQETPRDSGNQSRLTHRVAGVIYDAAERLRNRLPGFDTQQGAHDFYRRVQCCGDESDLHSKIGLCANKRGHENFISVKNHVNLQHRSEGFCDCHKMLYIKVVCDLTVRLRVNHTSLGRPKDYPCGDLGGDVGVGIKRFGTGLVFQVRKKFAEVSNTPCPCRYCSVYPDEAKTDWAEFAVATAAQIVYDNDECKRTSCRLWFDSDEDFVHAPSLKGRFVENFHKSQDFRILCCVTHDQEVSQRLEGLVAHFNGLRQQHKLAPENDIDDDKLAVLISQHHGLSKKIQTGRATMKMDDEVRKWSYDIQTCPGSCGAPVCILGKGQGSSILTTIHNIENESTGFYI